MGGGDHITNMGPYTSRDMGPDGGPYISNDMGLPGPMSLGKWGGGGGGGGGGHFTTTPELESNFIRLNTRSLAVDATRARARLSCTYVHVRTCARTGLTRGAALGHIQTSKARDELHLKSNLEEFVPSPLARSTGHLWTAASGKLIEDGTRRLLPKHLSTQLLFESSS